MKIIHTVLYACVTLVSMFSVEKSEKIKRWANSQVLNEVIQRHFEKLQGENRCNLYNKKLHLSDHFTND